jgi:hypothetical protein
MGKQPGCRGALGPALVFTSLKEGQSTEFLGHVLDSIGRFDREPGSFGAVGFASLAQCDVGCVEIHRAVVDARQRMTENA